MVYATAARRIPTIALVTPRVRWSWRRSKGQGGGVVEADETYIGKKPGRHRARSWGHKNVVFSLV